MSIITEFRQFVQRGNVIDMAVGIIMGAAFQKIVSSVVADIIMPPIGYVIGGVSFKDLCVTLPPLTIKVPDPSHPGAFVDKALQPATINYGNFLQTTFDFLIIAFCIFLIIKGMNTLHRRLAAAPPPPVPPEPTTTEKLLIEIRDLLAAKQS